MKVTSDKNMNRERVAIIGAGISGLSCGYFLDKEGEPFRVFEASDKIGGLARSFKWNGMDCDLGPHRLFSRNREILNELLEITPMVTRKRRSKIFIKGKVINDPVNPVELALKFDPLVNFKLVHGYIFKKKRPETTFENMALNAFGRGLYDFFFRPYTEKLLGIRPAYISKEWGKKKIRVSGIGDIFTRDSKVFFKDFYYPVKGGYGAIVDSMYKSIKDRVNLSCRVTGLEIVDGAIKGVKYTRNGMVNVYECDRVISTIPVTILARMLGLNINLRFQPVKLVFMMVKKERVTPYQWIYFSDHHIVINRLTEFKNFYDIDYSTGKTVLCAEVTCETNDLVGDVLKVMYDNKFFRPGELGDTFLIDEKFGYPVYMKDFELEIRKVQKMTNEISNLHLVGRNSEFRHYDLDENYASAKMLIEKIKIEHQASTFSSL